MNTKANETIEDFATRILIKDATPDEICQRLPDLEFSAMNGNILLQRAMASIHFNGIGVEQDYKRAIIWATKAAEAGSVQAMVGLSSLYLSGVSGVVDVTNGIHWLRLAAQQGHVKSQLTLGELYQNGEHGNGIDIPVDDTEAFRWYSAAAEQGEIFAQYCLAEMYFDGRGVPNNYSEALKWYEQAAEQGHIDSMSNIGHLYYHGKGVKKNYAQALYWYQNAAKQGDALSQFHCGTILRKGGFGVEANEDEAVKYVLASADNGFSRGAFIMGLRYQLGRGVPFDLTKASHYYSIAVQGGDKDAKRNLEKLQSGNFSYIASTTSLKQFLDQVEKRQDFTALLQRIPELPKNILPELNHWLMLQAQVTSGGNQTEAACWQACLQVCQAQQLGYSFTQLAESTGKTGPIYNTLDGNGCPIPGEIDKATPDDVPGFRAVSGIEIKNGKIGLIGVPAKDQDLPYITSGDFEVAMALAFGNRKIAQSPSFSLDSVERNKGWRLNIKTYKPSWLGATDFGRSLFLSDYIMKQIGFLNGAFFSVTDPTVSTAIYSTVPTPDLILSISNCDGEEAGDAGRLEIRLLGLDVQHKDLSQKVLPESNLIAKLLKNTTFKKKLSSNSSHQIVEVVNIHCEIEGAGTRFLPDGSEDKQFRVNDQKTWIGRRAKMLTDNYAEVSQLFPIFERTRQLLALSRLLIYVRENTDFRPDDETQKRLEELIDHCNQESTHEDCMLVPKPYHRDGCLCEGGVSMRGSKVEVVSNSNNNSGEDVTGSGSNVIYLNHYMRDEPLGEQTRHAVYGPKKKSDIEPGFGKRWIDNPHGHRVYDSKGNLIYHRTVDGVVIVDKR